jgi:2-dehydro-3-deoxy-L-rhamnonate dehydrogenase (NAD+)
VSVTSTGDTPVTADPRSMGRVLVTGAGSGLVAAVADAVAAAGGQPLVVGPVAPGARHVHFEVDLTDTELTGLVVAFIAEDGLDAVVVCDDLPETAAILGAARAALQLSRGHVVTVSVTPRCPVPHDAAAMVVDALSRR